MILPQLVAAAVKSLCSQVSSLALCKAISSLPLASTLFLANSFLIALKVCSLNACRGWGWAGLKPGLAWRKGFICLSRHQLLPKMHLASRKLELGTDVRPKLRHWDTGYGFPQAPSSCEARSHVWKLLPRISSMDASFLSVEILYPLWPISIVSPDPFTVAS